MLNFLKSDKFINAHEWLHQTLNFFSTVHNTIFNFFINLGSRTVYFNYLLLDKFIIHFQYRVLSKHPKLLTFVEYFFLYVFGNLGLNFKKIYF